MQNTYLLVVNTFHIYYFTLYSLEFIEEYSEVYQIRPHKNIPLYGMCNSVW